MVGNTESTNQINVAGSSLFAALNVFVKSSEFGRPVTADLSDKILAGKVDYANPDVRRSMAEKSTRGEVQVFEAKLGLQQTAKVIAPSTTRVGWLPSNPINQTDAEKLAPTTSSKETFSGVYPTDPDKQPKDSNPDKAKP